MQEVKVIDGGDEHTVNELLKDGWRVSSTCCKVLNEEYNFATHLVFVLVRDRFGTKVGEVCGRLDEELMDCQGIIAEHPEFTGEAGCVCCPACGWDGTIL